MTLEQFKHESQRLAVRLAELDPATPDYGICLSNMDFLNRQVLLGIDAEERLRYYEEEQAEDTEPDPKKVVTLPIAALDELDTPAEDEDEEDGETASITFDELHARYASAAKNHIEVGPIIRGLGFEKLSAIPENRYADALAALDEAEKAQAK